MNTDVFSSLEIDAIGEILNISLGASATAVSTMLNTRVDITTPVVDVVSKEQFRIDRIEPAIGVEITYISGLEGSNVMLLKRHDVKVIIEMLMGMEISDEEFQLDEMNISAICEVMNQMMGASSTALSEFLGRPVNISTPISFEISNEQEFVDKYFKDNQYQVLIGFTLKIGEQLESEFFNVMPVKLAKSLVRGFLPEGAVLPVEDSSSDSEKKQQPITEEDEEISAEKMETNEQNIEGSSSESAAAAQIPVSASQNVAEQTSSAQMPNQASNESMLLMMQMMQQIQELQKQVMKVEEETKPKIINVHQPQQPVLEEDSASKAEQEKNMEMIMGVPLELSVEIGRTKKLVKDILQLSKGSLVVLDKLAGEQVDLYVNGQCIAKGDVVVVEDNFGIRITEILKMNWSVFA